MHERTPSNSSPTPERNSTPAALSPKQTNPIPKTGTHSTSATRVKSFVRNILLASPAFPRLYADVVIASAPNSNEAKILAHNYKKIIERTKPQMASKSCTHIKVTGVRCDSPALRGEQFCYFHQRMLRSVRVPNSRIRHAALLEDAESIQASLMEVVNALLCGTIELKRGELILRALNTAVRNIRRVRFDLHQEDMVKEIPNYPDPPQPELDEQDAAKVVRRPTRPPTREEVARSRAAMLAEYYADVNKSSSHSESKTVAKANAAANETTPVPLQARVATDAFVRPPNVANAVNVGTAAPGCPGGPEVSGRSAVAPKPAPTPPTKVIARKPPRSVKPEAPKERKNAAHGASRG